MGMIVSTWPSKARNSWNSVRSARRVVGYAVTRGDHVLELMTAPDHSRAAADLLARCCADAVENDRHCVVLHGPPSCRLFKIFDEAGGAAQDNCTVAARKGTEEIAAEKQRRCQRLTRQFPPSPFASTPFCSPPPGSASPQTPEQGEVCMMRLLDPPELLRRLCGLFDRRAAKARLPRPSDLGLMVEGQKHQLDFREDGVRADTQHIGRSYLRLSAADFTRLLLGQFDWDAALADGRLECSTTPARLSGRALFPPLPFWRPPWDDLPAQ